MNNNKTLLQTVQRLEKKDLLRYASNIGMNPDENMDVSELRKAYADYILSNPKEILIRLPKREIDIIERAKNGSSQATIDLHTTPIMVLYGMADIEPPHEGIVIINIPDDLNRSLSPHIHWALNDKNNQIRLSVECLIEGLANIVGIVDQEGIRMFLKDFTENKNEDDTRELLNTIRSYSLLLDSMEWADDLATANSEDIEFVSPFGWEDKAKMKKYIEQHSSDIAHTPAIGISDLILSSNIFVPIVPNERMHDFMKYLTSHLGFDLAHAYMICFNLWYYKNHRGEYSEEEKALELYFISNVLGCMPKAPTDEQAEETMKRMADYVDHLPLWKRAGHTATEYPSDRFVRTLTTKEPLGPMVRMIRKEARLMTDILNSNIPLPEEPMQKPEPKNPWVGKKIGRNDPCPCGSGLKYKKCHGK